MFNRQHGPSSDNRAIAESVETAKPLSIPIADVVGVFEAIIRSMAEGRLVKVR
jgi:hypothetical protein